MNDPKTTALTTVPPLIRQSHGGALRTGGTPGNRGGAGAPPSELRARLRGSAAERIAIAEEIVDNPEETTGDRLRALDLLLRYGFHGLALSEEQDGDRELRVTIVRSAPSLP